MFVHSFTNLYGCRIGDDTRIGPFVEIQRGAVVGARCKIQSHTFVCDGVVIEDEVFVGHGVMFINDRFPRAVDDDGELKTRARLAIEGSTVERGAAIGSGAVILAGVRIGAGRWSAPAPSSRATCRPGRSSRATRRASIAR